MQVMTNVYCLHFISSIKLYPIINIGHLKPYIQRKDDNPIQLLKKPKVLDWANKFDVQRILDHTRSGQGWKFLVE